MSKNLMFFLLGIVIFNTSPIYSQNLVPNSSFEELRGLPIKNLPYNHFRHERKSGNKAFRNNLNYWYSANKASPDLRILNSEYYTNCKSKSKECGKARTGQNALGIITSMQNDSTTNYREYIEVKLKHTLKKNVKTNIEFWVRSDYEATQFSNNLGCYFSKKKIYTNTFDPIHLVPQVNHDSVILADYTWKKIKKEFMPSEEYAYLTIGNFYTNKKTIVVEKHTPPQKNHIKPKAYYVIDDIRVWQYGDKKEVVFKNKALRKGQTVELKNIEFTLNSFELKKESFEELDELANFLKKSSNLRIGIYGHTDNSGDKELNLALSKNRAKSVCAYLKQKGISQDSIEFNGFGASKPIADNSTSEGRKANRRVEFVILEMK